MVALAAGCARPEALRRIEAAHPGASYEGSTTGCGAISPTARRFGGDLRAAVLWARQAVHTTRALPCEATIEAVSGGTGGTHRAVYRVTQRVDGTMVEGAVEHE